MKKFFAHMLSLLFLVTACVGLLAGCGKKDFCVKEVFPSPLPAGVEKIETCSDGTRGEEEKKGLYFKSAKEIWFKIYCSPSYVPTSVKIEVKSTKGELVDGKDDCALVMTNETATVDGTDKTLHVYTTEKLNVEGKKGDYNLVVEVETEKASYNLKGVFVGDNSIFEDIYAELAKVKFSFNYEGTLVKKNGGAAADMVTNGDLSAFQLRVNNEFTAQYDTKLTIKIEFPSGFNLSDYPRFYSLIYLEYSEKDESGNLVWKAKDPGDQGTISVEGSVYTIELHNFDKDYRIDFDLSVLHELLLNCKETANG